MSFSEECKCYIDSHLCNAHEEMRMLELIEKNFPTSSYNIDWNLITNKRETNAVSRENLNKELVNMASSIEIKCSEILYIINIDNAFPALKTRLSEWLTYISELDFVDTIFITESGKKIIHWDFYKNLHATKLAN